MAYTPQFYYVVPDPDDAYLWLVIVGGIICWCGGWGIGANDTSNSWGSSVGAKAISVRNAAILAGIFETAGAFALGANVGGTVKKKVVDPEYYCGDHYQQVTRMNGMLAVGIATFLYLALCSKFAVPVSTTHAAVGGVCGFGIVTRGWGAITWWRTMVYIFISWVTSPLLSALIAFVGQTLANNFLLTGPPGTIWRRNVRILPLLTGLFLGLAVVFAFFIGGKSNSNIKTVEWWVFLVVFWGTAIVSTIVLYAAAYLLRDRFGLYPDLWENGAPYGKPRVGPPVVAGTDSPYQLGTYTTYSPVYSTAPMVSPAYGPVPYSPGPTNYVAYNPAMPVPVQYPYNPNMPMPMIPAPKADKKFKANAFNDGALDDGEVDIYEGYSEERIAVEQLWVPICWLVASVESFSHGANDVGNAIGPYAAMLDSYNSVCKATSDIPYWILGVASSGILIGLVTYGHRVMKTLGVNIAKITPQRAVFAEFGAVVTILIATSAAIPVSTTHCSVGGITGMSLAGEGPQGWRTGWRGVKWTTVRNVVIAILLTVPSTAILTAAIFGFLQSAVFGAAYPGPTQFNEYCSASGPWPPGPGLDSTWPQ